MASKPVEGVTITTAPDDDGFYRLALEWGPDDVEPLTETQANKWVEEIMWAVSQAVHDAAVYQLFKDMGEIQDEAIALLVREIRETREKSIQEQPDAGLRLNLVPVVSALTGDPYLHLMIDGKRVGQWTPEDARSHAMGILQAVATQFLDSVTLTVLIKHVGLDMNRAQAVISDLGRFTAKYN